MTTLVRDALVKETAGGHDYEAAMNRQLDMMNAGYRLRNEGEDYPSRDTLHER